MNRLLIATTNPGKIREVTGALEGLAGWDLVSLRDLPRQPEPSEAGRTFLDNAVAKALAYSRLFEGTGRVSGPHGPVGEPPDRTATSRGEHRARPAHPGEPQGKHRYQLGDAEDPDRQLRLDCTLADDSGLCVDALGGEPGVRSARYGGAGLDDPGRCGFLLEKLRDVPEARRGARFECVLALASGGALVETFTGTVEGRLLLEPQGEGGFGYDPIFFYPPAGRTFAQMTREEKSAVSHRGRALAALRRYLEEEREGPL